MALFVAGCSSGPATVDGGATPPPPAASQRGTQAAAALADAGFPVATVHTEYVENEFTESDHSRDPFRSFASLFVEDKSKQRTGPQVAVLLGQYSIDELKLVAIQTGGDVARAQLVDPTTKGWTIKTGDIVHVGGSNGADYQLNWRVDRIRDGDIVLTREDPAQPMVPPATRVIPLHPEAEQQTQNQPM
jgi:type IV pilus assembly protein PilP